MYVCVCVGVYVCIMIPRRGGGGGGGEWERGDRQLLSYFNFLITWAGKKDENLYRGPFSYTIYYVALHSF